MIIDIIDYTQAQFTALTVEEFKKVQEAQSKKNKLNKALRERLEKEKAELIDGGVYLSQIWERRVAQLTNECDEEVAVIRENLLYYLHYSVLEHSNQTPTLAPYPLDYSLSEEERMVVAREYYMNAYSNAAARLQAFQKDNFTRAYLGDTYASLYYYFQDLEGV